MRAGADRRVLAAVALATATACVCGLLMTRDTARGTELLGTWEVPSGIGIDREPYSAPPSLWLYWGSTTNRRMEGSGENVRHIFKLGRIEGGEYRDPQVLLRNRALSGKSAGASALPASRRPDTLPAHAHARAFPASPDATPSLLWQFLHKIDGTLFTQLSQSCCTSLVMPPFEWDVSARSPTASPKLVRVLQREHDHALQPRAALHPRCCGTRADPPHPPRSSRCTTRTSGSGRRYAPTWPTATRLCSPGA